MRVEVDSDSKPFQHRCALEHSVFYKEKEAASLRAIKKLILVATVSFFFCGTEAAGGILSGSLAILTDAAH